MSVFGTWTAATIASGAMVSAAIDLGRDYDKLALEIPQMTNCKMYLKVAETLGGTYYDLGLDTMTEEGMFNRADIWELGGWRYVKVCCTVPQGAERLVRIKGERY